MSNAISALTELARAQVGVRETGANNVLYNTVYYGKEVNGAAYPWCCAFIWWLFHTLSLETLFCGGQKTAYCPFVVSYAQRNGRWFGGDYQEGDLLLYDWDGDGVADHIGYCVAWDGSRATAIEGNAGDAVSIQTRAVGSIMGAYRPEYKDGDAGDAPVSSGASSTKAPFTGLPTLRRGDKSDAVAAVQHILLYAGYVLPNWGADGEFGAETELAVKAFQAANCLEIDGVAGRDTLAAMLS